MASRCAKRSSTLGFVGDGDGQVTEPQLDKALDVLAMAYPHGR